MLQSNTLEPARAQVRGDVACTMQGKSIEAVIRTAVEAWVRLKAEEVPKINELIKQADVPALTVTQAAKPSPAAALGTRPGSAASPAVSSTPGASPSPGNSPQQN